MPGTVLRVSGPYNKLSLFLESIPLDFIEAVSSKLQRVRGRRSLSDPTTYNLTVVDDDGFHVPVQVRESEKFLREHFQLLKSIMTHSSVDSASLDFGWCVPRDSIAPYNLFSHSLLALLGELEIRLDISLFMTIPESD